MVLDGFLEDEQPPIIVEGLNNGITRGVLKLLDRFNIPTLFEELEPKEVFSLIKKYPSITLPIANIGGVKLYGPIEIAKYAVTAYRSFEEMYKKSRLIES